MSASTELLPHDLIGTGQRLFEVAAILAAGGALIWHVVRLVPAAAGSDVAVGWLLLAAALGMVTADFASGLVHWLADTWFGEDMPVLGRRLLRPFRVHHVNPRDFLCRDFVDTNGDVAAGVCLILAGAALVGLGSVPDLLATSFLVAFAAAALPTNQVHQWAHMPRPPRPVAWLQRWGVILSREAHARHHQPPHTANYCIATGWLNPWLSRVRFFSRLERAITRVTGATPRRDDARFRSRHVGD